MQKDIKITFGCIVFNTISTLPNNMLEYCIENIYDKAHEIIIIEGATKSINHYWDGDTSFFTKDGRSTDGTLEYLYKLKKKFPKIEIITKEGFWDGKTEMCNVYAALATGDYIWQLDSDEFYKEEDILKIIEVLTNERPDAVHFYANHFFGGFDYCIDEKQKKWGNDIPWMRIFRHIPNKSYWISHEPPNYVCNGNVCNNGKVISRDETLKKGIKLYHYSYVCESEINFKSKFYRNNKYIEYWNNFKFNKDIEIFGSKLTKFEGQHPNNIQKLISQL